MAADQQGLLVGTRHECPLVVGVGEDEQFIASAIPGFLKETRRVMVLNDDEIAVVRPSGVEVLDCTGVPLEREAEQVDWDEDAAEKGGYETFMLKEIHEQADAVAETVADRLATNQIDLGEMGVSDDEVRALAPSPVVAGGPPSPGGLVGRYAIEEGARVRVDMDIAS